MLIPGGFMLVLRTKREGGPFACEFSVGDFAVPSQGALERGSQNAQYILWRHIATNAPGVYADAVARGWVPS